MTDPSHARVRDLFDRASELPVQARSDFLAQTCGTDSALRARVDALLAAGDDARFLTEPTAAVAGSTRVFQAQGLEHAQGRKEESPGAWIGHYRLVKQIGEGGFGVVFLAQQDEPVARRVALKIVKLGMDTRQVVARFEVERQALALMDHPHIARVIDAGATDSGRPYFVMEYVAGRTITTYCDEEHLTIDARLELFEQVCNAVQHAHSKGIIHRDLKPSNILVATVDGRPQAKVIDFGIAKATQQKLTDKTLFTEHQQVIGTLQYMSPEQAGGSLDIDTRTDVYALGVVLYELLTGTTPFETHTLHDAFLSEIQRIIREVDPPKPSTRLNQSVDTLAGVAARRRIEPKRLGTIVRGDLDWIVMKALEKDRARRYESAHGFGQDLRRYLQGEAVVAAPPSALYRLRKFSRRNRAAVLSGSAVAGALVVGVIAFAWQANIARDQRDAAVAAREAEAQQRRIADEQRAEAGRQQALAEANAEAEGKARDRAEATATFVTNALRSADPNRGGKEGISVAQAMEQAVKQLDEGAFRDEPDIEASLRGVIADVLYRNARVADALPLAEKALAIYASRPGDQVRNVARSTNLVATIQQDLGHADLAEPLFERGLALLEERYPGDDDEVATALNNLAMVRVHRGRPESAEPLFVRSIAMRERLQPGDSPELAMNLNNLANVVDDLGRRTEALPLFERSLAMYDRLYDAHPELAMALYNIAQTYIGSGRLADAEAQADRALAMYRTLFAGDHPDVARAMSGVANVRRVMGHPAESEERQRAALEMRKRLFPGDHPEVALGLESLTQSLKDAGKDADAEPVADELLAMRRRLAPGGNPYTARALDLAAAIRENLDRTAEAEPLLAEAIEVLTRFYGADHPDIARAQNRHARVLADLGRVDEAILASTEALAMMQRGIPGDHPSVAAAIASLGLIHQKAKQLEPAEARMAEALAMARRCWKGDHYDVARALVNHARALDTLGRKDEARRVFDEAVAMERRRMPGGSRDTAGSLYAAGSSLLSNGDAPAALPLLEEAASMGERVLDAQSTRLSDYRKKLDECRTKLGR